MGKATTTIVIDNGAALSKVGFAGQAEPIKVMPNYIAKAKGIKKPFIADQIDSCDDIQSLSFRRPFDRGYVVQWDAQKEIWDRAFKTILKVKPSECRLLVTEPMFNLPNIQAAMDAIIFEDYGFYAMCSAPAPAFSHRYMSEQDPVMASGGCSLVLDSGFSFTHAVPICNNTIIKEGVRRINLGGKALTNYLKELVSYRAWNMMDETFLIEDVKEKLCFTSFNVRQDLDIARKPAASNRMLSTYVLPDGVRHRRGYVKDPAAAAAYLEERRKPEEEEEEKEGQEVGRAGARERAGRESGGEQGGRGRGQGTAPAQKKGGGEAATGAVQQELTLTNERFMVPEMLFHPADLGVSQAGVAECIVEAVSACAPELHPLLYSSIVLTGGSTLYPGFKERLARELRPLVPDEFSIRIFMDSDPILAAWKGASAFAASHAFDRVVVTKREYEEQGSARCRRRFTF